MMRELLRAVWVLAMGVLLTGCQGLSLRPPPPPPPPPPPTETPLPTPDPGGDAQFSGMVIIGPTYPVFAQGAVVRLTADSPPGSRVPASNVGQRTTGADGRFEFTGLNAGNQYSYTATKDGYRSVSGKITAGASSTGVTITLLNQLKPTSGAGNRISGIAMIQDPGVGGGAAADPRLPPPPPPPPPAPLAGARVVLMADQIGLILDENVKALMETRSGPDGRFAFDGVSRLGIGRFQVRIVDPRDNFAVPVRAVPGDDVEVWLRPAPPAGPPSGARSSATELGSLSPAGSVENPFR